jgi:D-alanyl-D-alanine carboxypeptidase/D-alanyl-D-alanine-endopeptidase (penicillin-binding protein 4)
MAADSMFRMALSYNRVITRLIPFALAVSLVACHATPHPARPAPPAHPALEQLKSDIDKTLSNPALAHGYWGVVVKSLKTGDTLYSLNAQRLMIPASNMKIVTLASAAETLGWEYTYETRLLAAGPIEGGILRGDLIVVGSGDPGIGAANGPAMFDEWAARLKSASIRSVAGRVIGDDTAFNGGGIGLGFGWSWDDTQDDYSAPVSALQYDESAVRLTISPGPAPGDWAGVAFGSPDSDLAIDSAIKTSAAGSPASVEWRRLPGSPTLTLRGTVPAGGAPVTPLVSVDNPTQFFVNTLRRAMIERGINISGPAVDISDISDAPRDGRGVATHRSAPLSTLAIRFMKISQNLYGETFFHTLGGRDAVLAALKPWGVGPDALIVRDGSGLSRYDFVTPEALITILTHIDGDPTLKAPFVASLPIAGGEGLSSRMKGTAAEGNARAKTGSMTGVRTLSGYVTTADGEPLVFSILANNFETAPDTITRTADAIVVRLAEFKR